MSPVGDEREELRAQGHWPAMDWEPYARGLEERVEEMRVRVGQLTQERDGLEEVVKGEAEVVAELRRLITELEAERDQANEALWQIVGLSEAGPEARRVAGKALKLNSPGAVHVRDGAVLSTSKETQERNNEHKRVIELDSALEAAMDGRRRDADVIAMYERRITELEAERDRERQRIRDLAALFGVPDGGQYLNDWKERAAVLSTSKEKPGEAL